MSEENTRILEVKLEEIDAEIIKPIRQVKTESDEYKMLKTAIKKDGQRHPITIRELAESEKSSAKDGAKYGIIDGHHRFQIAQELGQATISAEITPEAATERDRARRDVVLAYRLNESTIKMTTEEKGKVIYDLLQQEQTSDGKRKRDKQKVKELGEEIFGLGLAMSYRALQSYRKSIGEKPQTKPHKDVREFDHTAFKKLFQTQQKIVLKQMKNLDATNCVGRIQAINELTRELNKLKKYLMSQDGVADELKNSRTQKTEEKSLVPIQTTATSNSSVEVEK